MFGIDFKVGSSNILVSALGYYDDGGNGFLSNRETGLYDSSGDLLGSVTVVSADPLIGHFRFHNLTSPVTLLAGQTYRVVGVSHNDNYTAGDPGFAAAPGVTYLGDTYDSGTTLSDPTGPYHDDVADGFWGPNILIGGSALPTTPAPPTWLLTLLGLGLVVLGCRRFLLRTA